MDTESSIMKYKTRTLKADNYSIRAIDRAVQVLSCFSFGQQKLSLGDFAQMTGLSKPTLFRILQTLEVNRFVSYDPESNHYSLGMKVFELGRICFSSMTLNGVAPRFIEAFASKSLYPVAMAVLSEGEVVYIDERKGTENVHLFGTEVGSRQPPHHGSHGMLLMAYLSEEEVDRLLQAYPLMKRASRSITDPSQFKERLQEIREKDYIYEESELVEGLAAVAAPIRNHIGKVIASVGTVLPSALATPTKVRRIVRLSLETAKAISEALGFSKETSNGTHLLKNRKANSTFRLGEKASVSVSEH
jgi:IclR family KDG regulon transcriptional repressor